MLRTSSINLQTFAFTLGRKQAYVRYVKLSMMIPGMYRRTRNRLIFVFLLLFISTSNIELRLASGQPPENNGTMTTTIPVNVGVVLDSDTWMGQMGLSCINMSLSDFYAANPSYNTRLVPIVRSSMRDNVAAAASGSLSLSL